MLNHGGAKTRRFQGNSYLIAHRSAAKSPRYIKFFASLRLCGYKTVLSTARRPEHHSHPILHHLDHATVNMSHMMFVNYLRPVIDKSGCHIAFGSLMYAVNCLWTFIYSTVPPCVICALRSKNIILDSIFLKSAEKSSRTPAPPLAVKVPSTRSLSESNGLTSILIFRILNDQISFIPGVPGLCTEVWVNQLIFP